MKKFKIINNKNDGNKQDNKDNNENEQEDDKENKDDKEEQEEKDEEENNEEQEKNNEEQEENNEEQEENVDYETKMLKINGYDVVTILYNNLTYNKLKNKFLLHKNFNNFAFWYVHSILFINTGLISSKLLDSFLNNNVKL